MGANGPTNPYYTSESETNTLITPVKRDIFSAILNYEISENVSFYGEVLYAESDATDTQNQPWYATGIISGVTLGGPWNIPFSNPYLSDAVKDILVPAFPPFPRSEEHTSELQSRRNLVCRLLLEKKKHLK